VRRHLGQGREEGGAFATLVLGGHGLEERLRARLRVDAVDVDRDVIFDAHDVAEQAHATTVVGLCLRRLEDHGHGRPGAVVVEHPAGGNRDIDRIVGRVFLVGLTLHLRGARVTRSPRTFLTRVEAEQDVAVLGPCVHVVDDLGQRVGRGILVPVVFLVPPGTPLRGDHLERAAQRLALGEGERGLEHLELT